ncbi:MAG: hypothetical protein H7844_07505 [Nitrospirae bacterium YQR-1]
MDEETIAKIASTTERLCRKAEPSDFLARVAAEAAERERGVLIDEVRLKRDRVWSMVSHQVVGAEIL